MVVKGVSSRALGVLFRLLSQSGREPFLELMPSKDAEFFTRVFKIVVLQGSLPRGCNALFFVSLKQFLTLKI